MPDLIATAGGATSNSFATVDEGDVYLDNRLNASAWTGASEDDKMRALIEATRELNLLSYVGDRTTDTQALSWPRLYAIDPDKPQIVGVSDLAQLYFLDTVVPTRIKNATIELALEFLRAGTTDLSGLDTSLNVLEKTVDVLTTKFAAPDQRAQGLARFPRVMTYIGALLDAEDTGGLTVVRT